VTTEGRRIIGESLRTNETFLRDLRRFFDAPTELLSAVADRIKLNIYEPLSGADADELSSRFGWNTRDLRRVATSLVYLRRRLIDTRRSPMDAISEIRNLLDQQDLAKGREDEIADVLSYSEGEREEVLTIRAFSDMPTFLNARFRPTFLTAGPSSAKLLGGYIWTISYRNVEGEERSVTIGSLRQRSDVLKSS
jgi:hypothetical protein